MLEYRLNIIAEAHVQHLVGLVQHSIADCGKVDRAAVDVVDNAAGRAHDYVRALAQEAQLGFNRLAAVYRQYAQPRHVLGHAGKLARHLQRQFARGAQHQRLSGAVAYVDAVYQRYAERRRLAGAGLRLTHYIVTLHYFGYGHLLYGRRRFKAHIGDCAAYLVAHTAQHFFHRNAGRFLAYVLRGLHIIVYISHTSIFHN